MTYTAPVTNNNGTSMVTGFFRDHDHARHAMDILARLDYTAKDINIMTTHGVSNLDKTNALANSSRYTLGNKALEGAGLGGAIGGTAGAIIAAILTVGTMVMLPGTGVIIAGPVVAAFAGAGAGGLIGGLIGLAIGARIPRDLVNTSNQQANPGGILMSVMPHSAADKELIERELVAAGSDLVHR